MQQPPRLVPPQGNGGGAGHRPTAPASVPPSTPRKTGDELNRIIRSLEDQHRFGLIVPPVRSPIRSKSVAELVADRIQQLYWSHRSTLDRALETFATTATYIPKDQKLEALRSILRSESQHDTPTSRAGTPIDAKNVPPKILKSLQPCKYALESLS